MLYVLRRHTFRAVYSRETDRPGAVGESSRVALTESCAEAACARKILTISSTQRTTTSAVDAQAAGGRSQNLRLGSVMSCSSRLKTSVKL